MISPVIQRSTILVIAFALIAATAKAEIRELKSKHLTLHTDMPPSPTIDGLPKLFDDAVSGWAEYFGVSAADVAPWQVTGCVMQSRESFERAGLVPADLPPFKFGYSESDKFWCYDLKSEYNQRHLLLHEGTHCFIRHFFGALGPSWYAEGMAELLGTHHVENGKPRLGYYPTKRAEVPLLNRIGIVQDDVAHGRALSLADILGYSGREFMENRPYAWSWAMAAFFDGHPKYRQRFRALPAGVTERDFTDKFEKQLVDEWPQLVDEWQVFIGEMAHGYDFERMAIDFRPGEAVPASGAKVEVAADRGWQSTGLKLEAGHEYHLKASGRYKLGAKIGAYPCEPGGVTIHYHRGRPRGELLAVVRPEKQEPSAASSFAKPIAIGLGATLKPETTGTLYLRINDSAAKLKGNSGSIVVEVSPSVK